MNKSQMGLHWNHHALILNWIVFSARDLSSLETKPASHRSLWAVVWCRGTQRKTSMAHYRSNNGWQHCTEVRSRPRGHERFHIVTSDTTNHRLLTSWPTPHPERQRERDMHTNRERERERDRERERCTQTETERERERETCTQTERERERHAQRDRERELYNIVSFTVMPIKQFWIELSYNVIM